MYCLKCGGRLEQKNGNQGDGFKEEYFKCMVCGTSHTRKEGDSDEFYILANKEIYVQY